jgi:predicted deacylase
MARPYRRLDQPRIESGVLYPKVDRDQTVAAGDPITVVTGSFGNQIAEVCAPIAGLVLYLVATPPTTKGQPVACIGMPISTAP